MFTGLIQGVGSIVRVHKVGAEMDLDVELGAVGEGLRIGDSVALSGVCCTLVQRNPASFRLSAETLSRTWFAALRAPTMPEFGTGAACR